MTKKHFIAIAEIMKQEQASRAVCERLARLFKQLNPNFDWDRFMTACGY